jgi:Tetrahydromethanopterin S-methyltransferase, subunit E
LLPDGNSHRSPVQLTAARYRLGSCPWCSRFATGNPYYGKERQYQNQKFGAGVPISASGNIIRWAEAGQRSSIDNGFFTSKFAGPASGLCFGLIVFFELWRTILFEDLLGGWGGAIVGLVIIIIFMIIDFNVEKWARKNYGPYAAAEA